MRKQISLLLAICVAFTLIGCGKKGQESSENQLQTFTVRTGTVKTGDIKDYIKLSGDIITKINVDAYADVQYGKITKLSVNVGDFVKKGQVIAKVDPSTPGTKYNESPVKAPISGFITQKMGQIGMTVNSSVSIYKIGNMDTLQVLTSVPERYVSIIYKNQDSAITLEAFSGEEFNAKITDISPVLDQSSRTMDVWMEFTGNTKGIKPGMFGTVKIYTESKKDVVILAIDDIVSRFGEKYVFVKKDIYVPPVVELTEKEQRDLEKNQDQDKEIAEEVPATLYTVEKRFVETGIRIDGFYEIISGVKEGETIVVKGHTLIDENSIVKDLTDADSSEEE